MHGAHKKIFYIVVFSLLAVQSVPSQTANSPAATGAPAINNASPSQQASGGGLITGGIGIQCGVRFHQPEEFNDFTTDIWNAILAEDIYLPADEKSIGPGVIMSLNGTVDIGRYFQVAPFVQGMWAGKQFYVRGGLVKDLHVNTYTALGGLNCWVRFVQLEKVSFRAGFGGYGTYTIAKVTGDVPDVRLSGSGFGARGLLGTEFRASEKIVVTLDCAVPFGYSDLPHQTKGNFGAAQSSIRYPSQFDHLGFELLPGVLFYF